MNYPVYHFILNKILEHIFKDSNMFMTKLIWEIDSSLIDVGKGESYPSDIPNYDVLKTEISYCYEHEYLIEYLQGTITWDLKDLKNIRIVNLDNEIKNILYKFIKDLEKNIK